MDTLSQRVQGVAVESVLEGNSRVVVDMTDSRLQHLKRTWETSRSTGDEAAYLRERVRVGALSQERLELAAYCAHEGAQVACSEGAPGSDCEAWWSGLFARFGEGAVAGCFALCGRHVLARVVAKFANLDDHMESAGSARFYQQYLESWNWDREAGLGLAEYIHSTWNAANWVADLESGAFMAYLRMFEFFDLPHPDRMERAVGWLQSVLGGEAEVRRVAQGAYGASSISRRKTLGGPTAAYLEQDAQDALGF